MSAPVGQSGFRTCPRCGSGNTTRITYGLVATLVADDRVLGGCCTYDSQPDTACRACGHRWLQHPERQRLLNPPCPSCGLSMALTEDGHACTCGHEERQVRSRNESFTLGIRNPASVSAFRDDLDARPSSVARVTADDQIPWSTAKFQAFADALPTTGPHGHDQSTVMWAATEPLLTADVDTQAEWLDSLLWQEDRTPVWLWLLLFQVVWHRALATHQPSVRRLGLVWMSMEDDALRDGFVDLMDRCRAMCPHLTEILDDDRNWTGYRLPGE